jgi:OTU-like cysteine protease
MSAISVVHGSYSQYINMMSRDREWGDGIMLAAICKCYNRPVVIHNEAGERVFVIGGSEGPCDSEMNAIHLIYAENHYKSLRHPVLEDVRSDHSNKRDCV